MPTSRHTTCMDSHQCRSSQIPSCKHYESKAETLITAMTSVSFQSSHRTGESQMTYASLRRSRCDVDTQLFRIIQNIKLLWESTPELSCSTHHGCGCVRQSDIESCPIPWDEAGGCTNDEIQIEAHLLREFYLQQHGKFRLSGWRSLLKDVADCHHCQVHACHRTMEATR